MRSHVSGRNPNQAQRRCGFVTLIGPPNAGKSTLINALVGTKVAAVSHKVQTSRMLLRGISIVEEAQLVLVDTPGIFSPKRKFDRAMVASAWAAANETDIIGVLVDAQRGMDDAMPLLDQLSACRPAKILILNKIDLVEKPMLLHIAKAANERAVFAATFMISALTGEGVRDVQAWLVNSVPPGPWLYPEDQLTDAPLRQLAAEITREKVYLYLHDELPYRSTVETDEWKKLKDGSIRIAQTIYVERENQRKIVLGKNGRMIKTISASARSEIGAMIEVPVHLFLFVKVRGDWSEDVERYRAIGLEVPKD
jgi:GTP-binding protein Era